MQTKREAIAWTAFRLSPLKNEVIKMYIRQELQCNGLPLIEHGYEEEILDHNPHADEPAYQPAPTCGQCEHFYQGKIARAKGTRWGYCPLLDAERRMSDKPCKLYKEDVPF